MHAAIATTELTAVSPKGERRHVAISIGTPGRDDISAFFDVTLAGLGTGRTHRIYGEHSFQALALAMGFVHRQLSDYEQRGWRFELEGEPFNWRYCWYPMLRRA